MAALVDQVQAAGRERHPVRPVGDVDRDYWAQLGGAFGQRMALLVAHSAPTAAYLGATRAGLLGSHALVDAIGAWPTRSVDFTWTGPETRGISDQLIGAVTAALIQHLERHAPVGHVADTRAAEQELARVCWVLSAWETVYRGGQLPRKLRECHDSLPPDLSTAAVGDAAVGLLLSEAPRDHVEELVILAGRLHGSGSLDQFRQLLQRGGVAGPVFVPHWADGDLLCGETLLDVKTVITLRDRDRIASWLHQLLLYAWLDEHDRHGIRNVGLYLARHGALITWPLDEFEAVIAGGTAPTHPYRSLRAEFSGLAPLVLDLEGATPLPAPGTQPRTA